MNERGWRDGLAMLVEASQQAGFRKRAGHQFTVELDDGVLGWVGLNKATRAVIGEAHIHPVIGVHHRAVHRRVAKLQERKPSPYAPAVSTPLYVTIPSYRPRVGGTGPQWVLTGGPDDDRVVAEIVQALQDTGLAWMRGRVTLAGLIEAFRAREGFAHDRSYYLPVALELLGQREAAVAEVEQELERIAEHDYPAAEDYRAFAARLVSGSPHGHLA